MTGLAYLAAVALAALGMGLIDHRWKLFAFRDARSAALVVAAGVVFLLAWDLVAIELGIFRVGESPGMTGVMLAPHLPLEEPVFLTFLAYCTMVLHTAFVRLLGARARRRAPGEDPA